MNAVAFILQAFKPGAPTARALDAPLAPQIGQQVGNLAVLLLFGQRITELVHQQLVDLPSGCLAELLSAGRFR